MTTTISLSQFVNQVQSMEVQAEGESVIDYYHRCYVYAESLYLQQFDPLPRKAQQLDRDRAKRLNDRLIEEMTLDDH